MGHGWAQVPAGDAVRRPSGALGRGFVRKDAAPWGPQRSFVEIECSVDLGVGRETGVDIGFAEEIEGENGVGDEAAPEVERESGVNTGEAGDKVGFEGVDCFFSRVCAVVVGGGELMLDIFTFEEGAERCGAFVVGDLEGGFETAFLELIEDGTVATQQFAGGAGLQGLGEDGIRVLDEGNHDVFVAPAGRDGKTACLVG